MAINILQRYREDLNGQLASMFEDLITQWDDLRQTAGEAAKKHNLDIKIKFLKSHADTISLVTYLVLDEARKNQAVMDEDTVEIVTGLILDESGKEQSLINED